MTHYHLYAGGHVKDVSLKDRFQVPGEFSLNDAIRYLRANPAMVWALATTQTAPAGFTDKTILLSWFAPANQWITTDGKIFYIGLNASPLARWTPSPDIPLNVHIWTDGSCPKQHKNGGWSARIEYRTPFTYSSGHIVSLYTGIQVIGWYEDMTTSQFMELRAVLGGLRAISHEDRQFLGVTVFLDSEWVQKCAQKIYQPTKYPAEFAELDKMVKLHSVNFTKIKGHSGIFENEQVDRLADYFCRHRSSATGLGAEDIIAPRALPREQFS